MKNKIFVLLVAVFAGIAFTGCEKEETTANVSRITYYPVMSVKGDQFMCIKVGEAFTDPGVSAQINGVDVAVNTVGAVDNTTIGVYTIVYEVTNADGFKKSLSRIVGVVDPTVSANNFAGTYNRSANQVQTKITKISDGFYFVDNVGGVDPANQAYSFPVYFYNLKGMTVEVPEQPNPLGGTVYCDNVTFTTTKYSWVVMGAGFGTALRTFIKK